MSNIFVGYNGCSTCKSALKYLKEKNVEFESREITTETPSVKELKEWHKKSGLDLKSFFNTRGGSYKDLDLKNTYDSLSDEERYELLSKDGMLIKRPILVLEDTVVLGFKKDVYDEVL